MMNENSAVKWHHVSKTPPLFTGTLTTVSAINNPGNQSSEHIQDVDQSDSCFILEFSVTQSVWVRLVGLFYWLFLLRGGLNALTKLDSLKISHGSYPQGIKNLIRCYWDCIHALFKENGAHRMLGIECPWLDFILRSLKRGMGRSVSLTHVPRYCTRCVSRACQEAPRFTFCPLLHMACPPH